jgi:hypothetical protein
MGFRVVHLEHRNSIEVIYNPLIQHNFQAIAVDDTVSGIFKLIQSQPQAGTSSTITREYDPEGRLAEFRAFHSFIQLLPRRRGN